MDIEAATAATSAATESICDYEDVDDGLDRDCACSDIDEDQEDLSGDFSHTDGDARMAGNVREAEDWKKRTRAGVSNKRLRIEN